MKINFRLPIIFAIFIVFGLVYTAPVSAANSEALKKRVEKQEEKMRQVEERVQERVEKQQEKQEKLEEKIRNRITERLDEIRKIVKKRAIIRAGEVKAVNGNSLIVSEGGKEYTVTVDSKTRLQRRYFGKAELSEIRAGHTVNVFGIWTDSEQTSILAAQIRDQSIQERFGVFVGMVKQIAGNTWQIETVNRGMQTVTFSDDTHVVNRRQEPITPADVEVGHRVRIKGLWDRAASTVTKVSQVKNYSLPEQAVEEVVPSAAPTTVVTPTVTVSPTVTITPTVTVTPAAE
jgi:cell division ATPase FtsA